MSERALLIESPRGGARIALPAFASLTLGSGDGDELALEGAAPEHLRLYVDASVAIEATERGATIDGRALAPGRAHELAEGAVVTLGAVSLRWIRARSVVDAPRELDRASWETIAIARASASCVAFEDAPPAATLLAAMRPGEILCVEGRRAAVQLLRAPSELERSWAESGARVFTARAGVRPWDAAFGSTARRALPRLTRSDDAAMAEVWAQLAAAASSDAHVLLVGETGVGKDTLAEELHARSSRRHGPLVRVPCAAISEAQGREELLSTLLAADGGSVILDEPAALGPRAQLALGQALDALEGRVRCLTTSVEPLLARASDGSFRRELYYRLEQRQLTIPPLRERPSDVLALAAMFAAELSGGARTELDAAARARLLAHRWPGNVRELRNAIARAFDPGRGLVAERLPATVAAPPPAPAAGASLREEIAALERQRILSALEEHKTQKLAAEALGIPLRTLLMRLDEYGIARPRGAKRPKRS